MERTALKAIMGVLVMIFSISIGAEGVLAGTVDPENDGHKYAYGENIGWLNFEPAYGGGVTVSDTILTGWVYAPNAGWIKLDPESYGGVTNDGSGNLSGWAWGENAGWISFSCDNTNSCGTVDFGVKIDPATGLFSGYAWGARIGWINFNLGTYSAYVVKTALNYSISGNAGTADATLSFTDGSAKTATADGNGDYSFTVSYNWSGTVTPSRTGYTFAPANRSYTNVIADQTNQDYTATLDINTVTVSGTLSDDLNNPLGGATVNFSHDGHNEITNATGGYTYAVPYGTTSTITPSHPLYSTWEPANRQLTSITTDQPNQDFKVFEDGDGVSSIRESGPAGGDPGYDGNDDSQPDNAQATVVSLHSFDMQSYVTMAIDGADGSTFANVGSQDNPSPGDAPTDTTHFPIGFFQFTVNGITPGSAKTVTLYLQPETRINTFFKYGPTPDNPTPHWYEFLYDGETGAVVNGNIVTLHFVDGKRGDGDISANGAIIDPGGAGLSIAIPTLNEWGMGIAALMLVLISLSRMRRRGRKAMA